MRRRKYKLHAAFLNATMVSAIDAPVEFEVSIGKQHHNSCYCLHHVFCNKWPELISQSCLLNRILN